MIAGYTKTKVTNLDKPKCSSRSSSGRFGPLRRLPQPAQPAIWAILQCDIGHIAEPEGWFRAARRAVLQRFFCQKSMFRAVFRPKIKAPELHKTPTGGINRTLSAACGCTRRNHVFAPGATHWRKYAILGKVYGHAERERGGHECGNGRPFILLTAASRATTAWPRASMAKAAAKAAVSLRAAARRRFCV